MSILWLCLRAFVIWTVIGFMVSFVVFGTNIGEPVFTVSLSREVSIRSGDLLMVPVGLLGVCLTFFDYRRFVKLNPVEQTVEQNTV